MNEENFGWIYLIFFSILFHFIIKEKVGSSASRLTEAWQDMNEKYTNFYPSLAWLKVKVN